MPVTAAPVYLSDGMGASVGKIVELLSMRPSRAAETSEDGRERASDAPLRGELFPAPPDDKCPVQQRKEKEHRATHIRCELCERPLLSCLCCCLCSCVLVGGAFSILGAKKKQRGGLLGAKTHIRSCERVTARTPAETPLPLSITHCRRAGPTVYIHNIRCKISLSPPRAAAAALSRLNRHSPRLGHRRRGPPRRRPHTCTRAAARRPARRRRRSRGASPRAGCRRWRRSPRGRRRRP